MYIYFVVPIILPLYHISDADLSSSQHLCHCIRCHPCLPSLSSSVYDSSVLVNLNIPYHYCPPPSLPYFPRLCCFCLHCPVSLPFSLSLPMLPLRPTLTLLMSDATKDLGIWVPVGQVFVFRSGGRHRHSGRATARHRIISPILRFWFPKTPATVYVPVLGRLIFSLGVTPFVWNNIISPPSVHWPLLLHRDDIPDPISLVPVRRIIMSLLAVF